VSRHRGKNRHRLAQNPQEQVFADNWERWNEHPRSILGYLVGDGNRTGHYSEEEAKTTATVIQWLGSPVGEAFLNECGYARKEKTK